MSNHLGQAIRTELAKYPGRSQKQFAFFFGVSPQYLCMLLNGALTLQPAMACRLAAAFGTTPEYWYTFVCADAAEAMKEELERIPRL